MGQLHCYVSAEVEAAIRRHAAERGLSVSQYLARLARHDVQQDGDWPEGYFDAVFGSMHEHPISRPPQGSYEERSELR